MALYPCQACQRPIDLPPSHRARSRYIFCSKECRATPCIPCTCRECGETFLACAKGVRSDGSQPLYCSRTCINARLRREQVHKRMPTTTLTCEQCGKSFSARRTFAKKGQRFCSKKCFLASGRLGLPTGPANPKWKEKVRLTCAFCGNEFDAYPSRADRKRHCSMECAIADPNCSIGGKPSITLVCLHCGKTYQDYPSRAARKFCSMRCMGYHLCQTIYSPSSLERKIGELLAEMDLSFVAQQRLGTFVCDFYVRRGRLVIECDGIYWHSRPEQQVRDARKDGWLTKHGYTILRLPERRIREDLDWCRQEILAALAFKQLSLPLALSR